MKKLIKDREKILFGGIKKDKALINDQDHNESN
jgi:hypothetical protein